MRLATQQLLKKSGINGESCVALIDGNKIPRDMPLKSSQFVIKGDSLIYSIAAASIIAKVTRDHIMLELDKKYPLYNLKQHKGYPTLAHRMALWEHGPCEFHRVSYAPVRLAIEHHKALAGACAQSSPVNKECTTIPRKRKYAVDSKVKTAIKQEIPVKAVPYEKMMLGKKNEGNVVRRSLRLSKNVSL